MQILDGELLGVVFWVPDSWTGIHAVGRDKHPGACIGYQDGLYKVFMLKGSTRRPRRYQSAQVFIKPDASNGLKQETAFEIKVDLRSARKVSLLDSVGTLSEDDLKRLQDTLRRLFLD